jgi:uncharacterized protein YjbI with pentapeptide repeats/endonuclease YncB( thermonuclease family)
LIRVAAVTVVTFVASLAAVSLGASGTVVAAIFGGGFLALGLLLWGAGSRIGGLRHRLDSRTTGVAAVVLVTLLACLVAAAQDASGLLIAVIGGAGFLALGAVLWWSEGPPRNWEEIGRTIMVSVALAAVVGIAQRLSDEGQKERDFRLSLTLQHDLNGANLANRDLSGVILQGKTLRRANLRGADLEGAKLRETDLTEVDFSDANLRNADLHGAHLDRALLAGADLRGATLKDGTMTNATLNEAHLQGANLELTNLAASCFANADLRDARFAGANLTDAVLTGADVRGAIFESDFRPANLVATGLAGVTSDSRTRWPLDLWAEWPMHGVTPPHTSLPSRAPARPIIARVLEVSDGDTFALQAEPKFWGQLPFPGRARLIGLNAPDLGDPGGEDAKDYVQNRLLGRRVSVQVGRDPLDGGRRLVYIWMTKTRTLNEDLLARGLATLQIRKNHELEPLLREAALDAKRAGRGIWKHCPFPGFFKSETGASGAHQQ